MRQGVLGRPDRIYGRLDQVARIQVEERLQQRGAGGGQVGQQVLPAGGQDLADLLRVLALVLEEAAEGLARRPGFFGVMGPAGRIADGPALRGRELREAGKA